MQLSGGNDFMNTLIPYTDPVYHDARPVVGIAQQDVLAMDGTLGFHPSAGPLKELYDQGDVAIVQGVGYPEATRSHFRNMDTWHTCDAVNVGSSGWLGKAIRELDPNKENPLTGVNIGRGLPRAVATPGVPVTSVGDLDNYGVMSDVDESQRAEALDMFKDMYGPAIGAGPVMDYLAQTGSDLLAGADAIKVAPQRYTSDVEYADNPIAKSLKDVARIHLAGLGTRVFYTIHGGYDTHANEPEVHPRLLSELTGALADFQQDLKDHNSAEEVVILAFTEFGRRIRDNRSGTDHGAGGGAFIIGDRVAGGLYAEYPSLDPAQWKDGEDLWHTFDFRGLYGTILEQWLSVEAAPIVGGAYEQINPFN